MTKIRLLISLLCLISILFIINDTFASENNDSELINIIENVKVGKQIKLSLHNDEVMEGKFYKYTLDSIYILNDETTSSFPITDINKFWVRGCATKKGALLGLIIGGGLALSVGIITLASDDIGDAKKSESILHVSVVGIVGGVLTGTTIGYVLSKWHLKYEKL